MNQKKACWFSGWLVSDEGVQIWCLYIGILLIWQNWRSMKKKKILEHEEWPEIKLVTSQKRSAKFF